ncbi:MAG: argininosuccinate lyase [Flammeovirgaceae bacterium]
MKIWEKGYSIDRLVEDFTVGNDRIWDVRLAKYDIMASLAHAKMLQSINILTPQELNLLDKELNEMLLQIEQNGFEIEPIFEDVHSKIEYLLTQRLGEVGKKIHTGRSRNDQVLVAVQLYLKDEILSIRQKIKRLFDELIILSEKHKDKLLVGYTHLQVAMPSSYALWLSAYAECLADDMLFWNVAYQITDQNPLGSAAGYGTSIPLNRRMTTELLGFKTLKYNSVAAQMNRSKVEKTTAFAMASLAGTLAKLSMDVCLYMSQNFGFVSFPDQLTTGSSIMPHKKNPDVFELIRAKCNRIQNLPNEIMMMTTNLPSGYHRDYQILKEILFPALDALNACLDIAIYMFPQMQVKDNLLKDERYEYIFSVELVNEEVMKGVPFREAYRKIADSIANKTYKAPEKVEHTHEGSIGNLCLEQIKNKFENVFNHI